LLAVIGSIFVLRRFDLLRFSGVMRTNGRIGETIQTWLRAPSLVIVLPLLFQAVLIVIAQAHAARFILVFIPVVCLLAAIAIEAIGEWLKSTTSYPIQLGSVIALTGLLTVQFADGIATHRLYSTDIRAELGNFLAGEKNAGFEASTFSTYTALKGVSLTDAPFPTSPIFVGCDLEYRRYLLAAQGKNVTHLFGGKARLDFWTSMLADRTSYATIFKVERKRLSFEDHLAEQGWIPELNTFVPNECRAFQKKGT
jgi:hypothetical protein